MTTKLTDRFFTSRKAPLKARTIYTDSVVPGLTFRVWFVGFLDAELAERQRLTSSRDYPKSQLLLISGAATLTSVNI